MTVVGGRREFDSPRCLLLAILVAQESDFPEIGFNGVVLLLAWEGSRSVAPAARQRSMQTSRHGRDQVPMANG